MAVDIDHCRGICDYLEKKLEGQSGLGVFYWLMSVDLPPPVHCLAWRRAGHTPPCAHDQHTVCIEFLVTRVFSGRENLCESSITIYKIKCSIL